jgi:biopolymer transport protein ExbD
MRIPAAGLRRRARIEIIPLIDIMFFLLATFVMVSLSMLQNLGMPVQLPAAHSAKPEPSRPSAVITVAKDGGLYWDKKAITLEGLPAELKALGASDGEAKVFIHGDKMAPFGKVVRVLDEVRQAGIRHTAIRTARADR